MTFTRAVSSVQASSTPVTVLLNLPSFSIPPSHPLIFTSSLSLHIYFLLIPLVFFSLFSSTLPTRYYTHHTHPPPILVSFALPVSLSITPFYHYSSSWRYLSLPFIPPPLSPLFKNKTPHFCSLTRIRNKRIDRLSCISSSSASPYHLLSLCGFLFGPAVCESVVMSLPAPYGFSAWCLCTALVKHAL